MYRIAPDTGEDAIFHSDSAKGSGVDLIRIEGHLDPESICEVRWEDAGLRHLHSQGTPVLKWRFARLREGNLRDEQVQEAKIDGGMQSIQNRLAELERVVLHTSRRENLRNLPLVEGRSNGQEARSAVVLQTLTRSEVYETLGSRGPRSLQKIVDSDLGLPNGRNVVIQSILQTRGANCTLSEFQGIVRLLEKDFPRATQSDLSYLEGRHGMIRILPGALRILYPNVKTDEISIEFESFGDMCDFIGIEEQSRGILIGKGSEDMVSVAGTTMWFQKSEVGGDRPPERYVFPARSPWMQGERLCLEPADADGADSSKTKQWSVEVLHQRDARIQSFPNQTMESVFESRCVSSAEIAAEMSLPRQAPDSDPPLTSDDENSPESTSRKHEGTLVLWKTSYVRSFP